MARRTIDLHVSCARCGYRGTDEEHVCNWDDRVRQLNEIVSWLDQAKSASPSRWPSPSPSPDPVQIVEEFARLIGRPITVRSDTRATHGALITRQRCRVCRTEIEAVVADHPFGTLVYRLASSIAHAYLRHECPSVESQLAAFSEQQLGELHEQLERDLTRIGERILELERLMGRR